MHCALQMKKFSRDSVAADFAIVTLWLKNSRIAVVQKHIKLILLPTNKNKNKKKKAP